MKLGKWVLAIAVVGLLLSGTAIAQHQPNELCMQAGARFYTTWNYGSPNRGCGKYFPSFAHWAGTSQPKNVAWPWKIDAFGWTGMQGNVNNSNWFFSQCLYKVMEDPYSRKSHGGTFGMSFDYPKLSCKGSETSMWPSWMWGFGSSIPGNVPVVGGDHNYNFPSTAGGFNSYYNIFSAWSGNFTSTLPAPYTIWKFSLSSMCADPTTCPSAYAVWQYVWESRPDAMANQYLLMSFDEYDCTGSLSGALGNKMCRNQSFLGDPDSGYYAGWNPQTGSCMELGCSLGVCDIVTIPVNAPGSPIGMNPYLPYGFDVGIASSVPFCSSGCVQLGFMTLANQSPGVTRAVIGSFNYWPGAQPWNNCLPYGPKGRRIAHAWDIITAICFGIIPVLNHQPMPGYPGYLFSSHNGAHTMMLPFPPDPNAMCLELRFSSFALANDPSASYMMTCF